VNIDHVATLRQVRGTPYPDPVTAASLAELAGAHGITVHLREDRRHIQERDLNILRDTVKTILNLEMAPTQEMVEFAIKIKPHMVTLVPEKREEKTTEGGLEVQKNKEILIPIIQRLKEEGIKVNLFVNPDQETINMAKEIGADGVELHTGDYCNAFSPSDQEKELERIKESAKIAKKQGLDVAAGHGLYYYNVAPIAAIPEIEELNIGHGIISRAVLVGIERAIQDMFDAMAGI
jgi:pyridoxine 5-phosphate synthase